MLHVFFICNASFPLHHLYADSRRTALTRGPSQVGTPPAPARPRGPLLPPLSCSGLPHLPCHGLHCISLFLSFLLLGAFLAVLSYLVSFGLS